MCWICSIFEYTSSHIQFKWVHCRFCIWSIREPYAKKRGKDTVGCAFKYAIMIYMDGIWNLNILSRTNATDAREQIAYLTSATRLRYKQFFYLTRHSSHKIITFDGTPEDDSSKTAGARSRAGYRGGDVRATSRHRERRRGSSCHSTTSSMSTRRKRRDSFARSRVRDGRRSRAPRSRGRVKTGVGKTSDCRSIVITAVSGTVFSNDKPPRKKERKKRWERPPDFPHSVRVRRSRKGGLMLVARLSWRERVRENSRVARLVARRGPNWHAPLPPSLFAAVASHRRPSSRPSSCCHPFGAFSPSVHR